MARVYTGKVEIPGEKIDDYFDAMQDREEDFKPFCRQLRRWRGAFYRHLSKTFSLRTARHHAVVIDMFIDFLQWHTDVTSMNEITRGIANSYFRKWYIGKIGDKTESELKTAIKKFFKFLDQEKGIRNEAVLHSFKR